MPIYEYKCSNGHSFEVIQRMSDDPVGECEVCSAPVERVFHPVAVHFKGSGFYTTDYGSKQKAGAASSSSEGSGDSGSGDSGPAKDSGSSSESKSSAGGDSKSSAGDGKAKAGSGKD